MGAEIPVVRGQIPTLRTSNFEGVGLINDGGPPTVP